MWRNKTVTAPVAAPVNREVEALVNMVMGTQAVIHFKPDGTILTANRNFLDAMGYELKEVEGRHHSMFVDDAYAKSEAYRAFWDALARGEHFTDRFPRRHKSGATIWIKATYAAVRDDNGAVERVIKVANDVTDNQLGFEAISAGLEALEKGDLTHRVGRLKDQTFNVLAERFDAAAAAQCALIGRVRSAASKVEDILRQLDMRAIELNESGMSQAAAVEQTGAATQQLSEAVQAAEQRLQNIASRTNETRSASEGCRKTMEEAVVAMSDLEEYSSKISEIVDVIDNISFQTNILALNAGVEAARAGESGRGFSIVAQEVRALAVRTVDAANEIKAQIEASNERIRGASGLVHRADTDLVETFTALGEIAEKVGEVMADIQANSDGLGEIGSAVGILGDLSNRNATLAEENRHLASQVSGEMSSVERAMSEFMVDAPTASVTQFRAAS